MSTVTEDHPDHPINKPHRYDADGWGSCSICTRRPNAKIHKAIK